MLQTFTASLFGLAAALATLPACAGPAKPVVLVELYTSQGCSSCPPADAMVAELAGRDDVLPLALHVDYWDYIGWADSFANPKYTARQKAYAREAGTMSIYTPQLVVEGVDHVVGFKPMKVADLIAVHRDTPPPVAVQIDISGDTLRLRCDPRADARLPGPVVIDLVRFTERASVDILHGENAGRTITYANIVTGWDRVGSWDGAGDYDLAAPIPADGPLALVIQAQGPGEVLAAFRLR